MKRPHIEIHRSNVWATTGSTYGPMRDGFYFTSDMGGSIDAPVAFPAGHTVKNEVPHRDRRRRPHHYVMPATVWRDT